MAKKTHLKVRLVPESNPDSKFIYYAKKPTKGEKVKEGQIIGTLGKSGRATGPHLDVRLNWFGVKLDPASVLKLN